ncbi:MAG: GNAT family N-acetyltransferase [Erysipelotrichaceae bacterium]
MFKDKINNDTIELVLERTIRKWPFKDVEYHYLIYTLDKPEIVGRCDFRLLINEENYYAGNIGYMIRRNNRGNNYAYQAAFLLCEMAKSSYNEIIITCSPENHVSKHIIEKLHGELIETIEVPVNHFLYKQGEKIKNIYKIDLNYF